MKRNYLKFPARSVRLSPEKLGLSRRWRHGTGAMCFESDGGTGADDEPDAETKALLNKVGDKIKTELEARGMKDKEAIKALALAGLTGLNIEALRKFDESFDPVAIRSTVNKMAAAIEKMQNAPAPGQKRANALRELLMDDKMMKKIERAFEEKTLGEHIVLNCRAAVIMDTANVVNDGDIPEDILNSFSVDTFVKKRRPNEFVWEVVTRRTIPAITEYKTWLEEGDEQGAFAIISQGAVKPMVSKTLVRNTTKYRKLAGKRVYTEEFKKFRQDAYTILEDLFNDQLLRNYAALIVTSINTFAAAYVGTTLDGQYDKPTDFHAIGAVSAQIEALDFFPDTLFLNPMDKWRIGLQQNDQGTFYVNIPVVTPTGEVSLMGFRVVTSNRVDVGYFYLGEARLYKVEDEPVTIRMGYGIDVTIVDGVVTAVTSDFDTNRFRIIAETFFHNYVATNHIGSFVKGNFNTIKTTLLKPAI